MICTPKSQCGPVYGRGSPFRYDEGRFLPFYAKVNSTVLYEVFVGTALIDKEVRGFRVYRS